MRTTLTLDEDIFEAASKRAKCLHVSLGRVISDLAWRGLQSSVPVENVNGFVVFSPPKGTPAITMRTVKEALGDLE